MIEEKEDTQKRTETSIQILLSTPTLNIVPSSAHLNAIISRKPLRQLLFLQ